MRSARTTLSLWFSTHSVTALLLVLATTEAAAQARWPISVELNVGRGSGHAVGGYRGDGSGPAIDALLGYRVTPGVGGGFVLALSANVQGPIWVDLLCIPAPAGGCVPDFPTFAAGAVLAGYETSANVMVRGLLGPAYVRADESTFGFQGRADLAVPLVARVSLVLSGRALLVPSYRGDMFRLYAIGFGFRVR